MTATMFIFQYMGTDYTTLSKEENLLLEVTVFTQICNELKEIFLQAHKIYFRALRYTIEKEQTFVETNFIRYIIQDILSTEEYSLTGVAYYTRIPEDILYDIITGLNTDPAASILRKIIELHRTIRPELYRGIIQKIINSQMSNKAA